MALLPALRRQGLAVLQNPTQICDPNFSLPRQLQPPLAVDKSFTETGSDYLPPPHLVSYAQGAVRFDPYSSRFVHQVRLCRSIAL